MGLKNNIGFAIEESDRIGEAVPFMTLVELDDYLTKMVQKEFGRKDIVVTVDAEQEQVFLGNRDMFDEDEDDNVEVSETDGMEVEGAEEAEFKEV